ncbi:metallophosphoesterase 1-like [Tubulanus polymorphus]|uniref:metallophosphoesterase 1-like n=1 Tax=Tubulanus polymorphus TaxID=672921 RepID=UPI003DA4C38C
MKRWLRRLYVIMVISCQWRQLFKLLLPIGLLVFFCEFLIYYVVLLQCSWPELQLGNVDVMMPKGSAKPLRILFLADTHLLGFRRGHWFDKLRREWQMERSFQSTMLLHNPDTVFLLGDVLDEGKWCDDDEFKYHVERFGRMFRHGEQTTLHVVAGNHDIGFHYDTTRHKYKRFKESFSAPSVRMLDIEGNLFILVNSMAFENDGCFLCKDAQEKLLAIHKRLNCAKIHSTEGECSRFKPMQYTRPILLQHFPLYRPSDYNCTGLDAPPPSEKSIPFKPKWDCLSKDATKKLLTMLDPRIVMSGHTHHGCFSTHRVNNHIIPEWTIASYSWRNKIQPAFLLATVTSDNFEVTKCFLPREDTVIWTYLIGMILIFSWFVLPKLGLLFKKPQKSH